MSVELLDVSQAEKKERFARSILNGFESYFAEFQNVTLAARTRFENADWHGMHASSIERIDLYKAKTTAVLDVVELIAGDQLRDYQFWTDTKAVYAGLIEGHNNFEMAETFFNSVYCAVFKHRKIRDEHAFVFSPQGDMPPSDFRKVVRRYPLEGSLPALLQNLFADYAFSLPYENLERDIGFIVDAIENFLAPRFDLSRDGLEFQMLEHHFFRNKGAYIVGRIAAGSDSMPIVFPLMQNASEEAEVFVDTVLFGADKCSVLFSFTRSYFMVDASIPSQYVLFLQQLMPAKPISEIYSAMGYNKHGKTYYHRCAYRHMTRTTDQFIIAPGIKGMVMSVFTMPSYDFVFKIIKDRFTPPKEMTHEQVKAKYRLVKRWDRAGRMADTQEFTNLAFARERFSEELMDELRKVAPSLIEEHGKALIIKHVYVERRMTPLNLYLQDASDEQIAAVMDEYGNAIKQLAAANIFPGDMLLKNFGVTRHGRVVFYDYDEIQPLMDCNFRKIPAPRSEAEELASKPWYTVGPNDIFPEEFRLFFSGNQRARKVFDAMHSDIYEVAFWQGLQERIRQGHIEDFFPYRRKLRFPREALNLPEAV
ncbi:bifunctional isocitrate dehydrogenase kinase/phosphatase [Parahaliea aestuarii]|uniref:Isocitrate dehydrogenase kinase/phosphatase n=1 Tax=Parahaliea aestuarii TaxID=1852021 RepID=A0A5C8ZNR8_9GAMM|nr:bifunctional isocitrate dehydrogenase kinase/phosphatase [Parahaliea aestuarii]TXS90118.1 bifunctional isocitrate dehydrogenase kinase/phosphatase [Parahaliea aestuarii]